MAFWKQHKLSAMLVLLALLVLLPLTAWAAEKGYVTASSLILRSSASKASSALQTLPKGTTVSITGSSGDWYRVTYGKYKGYVMKKYITKTNPSGSSKSNSSSSKSNSGNSKSSSNTSSKNTKTNTQEDLLKQLKKIGKPKACAPGSSGSNVTKLQRCLQTLGYYKGKVDGVYGTATNTRQTIAAMFGQRLEEDFVTERLDWFKNVYLIPKGAVFTVKDCRTGKTFQCKRWSGANHMDSMPLTKSDTAVMRSLYGQWSWRRRPILVKYNGHVYAASMNGMPHGTTTIKNNGFPGHFCIHFYKSMTHGSKKVDPTHQSCEAIAMGYKW